MLYLVISVLCSVSVGVLLKYWGGRGMDAGQLVTWNYLAASSLAWLVLRPSTEVFSASTTPWALLLVLGLALPAVFLLMARSLASAGIVRTDAAQRLSLLISLAAAFLLFGEVANHWKLAGLATGLVAIGCLLARPLQRRFAHRHGGGRPLRRAARQARRTGRHLAVHVMHQPAAVEPALRRVAAIAVGRVHQQHGLCHAGLAPRRMERQRRLRRWHRL